VRVGIGPTITVAATASAQVPCPGGVLAIEPADVAAFRAGSRFPGDGDDSRDRV